MGRRSDPGQGGEYNAGGWNAGSAATDGVCGTASGAPGPAVAKVEVAIQEVSTGLGGTGRRSRARRRCTRTRPARRRWAYAFPASQFRADGQYRVRSQAIDVGGNEELLPDSARFLFDSTAPTSNANVSGSGQNGWWRQASVTVTASDAAGGSGLARIEYRIDGGAWTTYSGAFAVTGDGKHLVEYRATA